MLKKIAIVLLITLWWSTAQAHHRRGHQDWLWAPRHVDCGELYDITEKTKIEIKKIQKQLERNAGNLYLLGYLQILQDKLSFYIDLFKIKCSEA